ncbi:hypothetical protein H2200_010135 [Cladophialophora chaetospira]|uniref:DUF7514 domain-containing protein n=1 Tax=Cladophialophora chaetospira TaxID=386627 RepID=A0AA38X287_9EURO|nr:hypothetical protein H2200_010135 [Cladophialophora chaetospira]
MARNNERLPLQPSVSSFEGSDDGDPRKVHSNLSNTGSESARYPAPRLSDGSAVSQHSTHSLDSSRLRQASQPINEAVTSAFNNAEATTAASIPPEFLQQLTSQITANVLQQLKASNLPLPMQQPVMPGTHIDASSSTAGSPPLDRATVYTPPSPHRYSDDTGASQPSPQFPPPSSGSSYRAPSPGMDRRAISPLSQPGHISESDTNPTRPKGPKRISTSGDVTTLERVWGQLFTEQGQATPRLGQFLRGIALHLIEDYEPKNSLVITPTKLQRYYEETKLSNELYPWKVVFDDRTSSISRMYRDIECQHHLVQEKLSERPDLPGLTPQGFETWATLLLKAHPDQEYERLAKTALDMPISNPDERKERFPKELSRRLFPTQSDTEIAYRLQKVMSTHCNVNFSARHASVPESQPRTSASSVAGDDTSTRTTVRATPSRRESTTNITQANLSSSQGSIERERQPYGGPASINGDEIENTEDVPTPQPIERERKPYVAAPGGGKTYEHVENRTAAPDHKTSSAPQGSRLGRSNSIHSTNRASADTPRSGQPPIAIHQRPPPAPMDIPEARHHRTNSTYHRDPARPGRNRSPSMSKENGASSYMRRTEPDVSYMSSSHHSDHHDDARRYKDYEAGRERLANDRYDAARMSAYDPVERTRDRDRDGRPRMQSISNAGLGFVDGPLSPTIRSTAGPSMYSNSTGGEEEYYLNRVPTGGSSAPHYNGHGGAPATISTGFQPPPPPPPQGVPRDSASMSGRDGYSTYPAGGYPPSSYRDGR